MAVHDFLSPVGRSLDKCGRIVVLGTDPDHAADAPTHIAQRALEGLTRSLGKEIGRGSTVQLVYVAPGAEDRIDSTLTFLLSPKSAYVSGQVIRIGTDVASSPASCDPLAPLAGKVALVTGASRGIGAAIAATLHRDGATIVGVDVPQAASDLQAVMDELDGQRISLDITAVDAPQRLAATLTSEHGGVDIVVHNAGITRDKKLVNMATDRWTSVIDVNLIAPERITTELLEQGVIRPNGRVIGVASIAGIAGNAGQTNYATSKAGVIGLVDASRPIAGPRGVTVNAVAPGFIETQMTAKIPLVIREAGPTDELAEPRRSAGRCGRDHRVVRTSRLVRRHGQRRTRLRTEPARSLTCQAGRSIVRRTSSVCMPRRPGVLCPCPGATAGQAAARICLVCAFDSSRSRQIRVM